MNVAPSDSSTSLKTCPRCDYNLTGLPDEHICPECGFEYDPHAAFMRLSRRRRVWELAVMATALLLAGWFLPRQGGRTKENVFFCAFILAALLLDLLSLSLQHVAASITLNRLGFSVTDVRGLSRTIPWRALRRARCGWISGNLIAHGTNRTRILILCRQLGGRRKARDLARQIVWLKSVYENGPLQIAPSSS